MNIGIDVDGVLADLMPGTLEIIKKQTGIGVDIGEYDSWTYLQDNFGFSTEEVLDYMDQAWFRGLVTMLEPGVQEHISRVQHAGHLVTIITQRTRPTHADAAAWLEKNSIPYDALVFNDGRNGLTKLDYPIDMLIDDSPYLAKEMVRYPYKTLYSLKQSWNNPEPCPDNVVHVTLVAEALELIERSSL